MRAPTKDPGCVPRRGGSGVGAVATKPRVGVGPAGRHSPGCSGKEPGYQHCEVSAGRVPLWASASLFEHWGSGWWSAWKALEGPLSFQVGVLAYLLAGLQTP